MAGIDFVGDQRRQRQSLAAIANQRLYLNEPTGWEMAERALSLARQLGNRRYAGEMLIGMGRVYVWSDQPERGTAYLEAALPILHHNPCSAPAKFTET